MRCFTSHRLPMGIAAGWLALFGAGCSRAPRILPPRQVYVDARSLARYHPQWSDVVEMDRQIAWLRSYSPRSAPVAPVANVSAQIARSRPESVDTGILRARITETLDAVHAREREALERRLERARLRERASGIGAERAALETEADRRFQEVLDRYGAEMANLDVKMSVTASLQRGYATRGPQWEDLAREMEARHAELKSQWEGVRAQRTAGVNAVFDWLEDQFRLKAVAEGEAALAYRREHQAELNALDEMIDKQKRLLLTSLPAAPMAAAPLVSGTSSLSGSAAAPPPLPGPALGARIAALQARRDKLMKFVIQNTEAVVKSVAARETPALQPIFQQNGELPDRTDVFRPAVQHPAVTLERIS